MKHSEIVNKSQPLAGLDIRYGGFFRQFARLEKSHDAAVAYGAYVPTDTEILRFKGAAFCIAQGINSGNGKLASQIACKGFMTDYYATPDYWTVKQSASAVIDAINTWLHHQDRNSVDSSSFIREDTHITSFSVLIIKSTTAYVFHVGNTRIFRLEDHRLHQLTQDHSLLQSDSSELVLRALGTEDAVDIDYLAIALNSGDRLLLSSAGLEGQDIRNTEENDLDTFASAIFDATNTTEASKPAAILIADIVSLPTEQADEALEKYLKRSIPPKLDVGKKIDHFTVEKILASGARSHVYLATSSHDNKYYVLKMPSRIQKDDKEYLQGFVLEQWIGLRLRHPTVMTMYEPPESSQFLYHVAEYIDGTTLRQWMTDHRIINLADARMLLHEMIKPVRFLHRNNLLHRDLKPENFIINSDGVVKLIDFGTVRVSSIQELSDSNKRESPVGDIRYIAPEVLIFGTSSNRSDLFSIACIIYEMLTRELPYAAILTNHDFPRQLDLWTYRSMHQDGLSLQRPPPWVDRVLKKALAPNPRERYETLSEFEADLLSSDEDLLKPSKHIPLIERYPGGFWKVLSLILTVLLVAQTIYVMLVLN